MDALLSVREVANGLGYSEATIRRWISEGKVNHIKFSTRGIRVPRDEIERLLGIGRQQAERSNRPTVKTTALATKNPASSGINPN